MSGLSTFEKALLGACALLVVLCTSVLLRKDEVPVARLRPPKFEPVHFSRPEPVVVEPIVLHLWQLADLYQSGAGGLVRQAEPHVVQINHVLNWTADPTVNHYAVQIGDRSDFSNERLHLESANGALALRQAFVGQNFWRVSSDQKRWSPWAQFQVQTGFLDEMVKAAHTRLEVRDSLTEAVLRWTAPKQIMRFVVEVSRHPDFPGHATIVLGLNEPLLRYRFQDAGSYFVRARGLNALQQLTEFSTTTTVTVKAPVKFAQRGF